MTFQKWQNYGDNKKINSCHREGERGEQADRVKVFNETVFHNMSYIVRTHGMYKGEH